MNLDELRTVQSKERSKDSLQHLRESFYGDVGEYIQELRAERDRVADSVDNPFDSEKVSRLSDEVATAEEVIEAIYERRVGKVVKRASLAAAGMSPDEEGLTNEEQELYADIVDRIQNNKTRVLDVLAGDIPADSSEGETATDAVADSSSVDPTTDPTPSSEPTSEPDAAAPEPSSTDSSTETDAEASSVDRTTLRIVRDVGDIIGVDEREYDLRSEDVVTLPTANAEPLLEQDAAEQLE